MRPIDADKVMEEINRIGGHNLCEWDTLGVKALICRQDTLDVVPREEVERIKREIFAEIEKILSKSRERYSVGGYHYDHYKRDNAFVEAFAELKKKYTEEQESE